MNQNDYFTEKIATLPEDLQEAILFSDYEKALSDIHKEYKLHIDQGQVLSTLATQLMFGDIDAPEFVNGMFNEAHVSSAVAGDILLKIDLLVLRKIRKHIEDIEEVRRKDEELKKLLMSDEEEERDNKSDMYANYYADMANARLEAEQELLAQGILPDGSNITDEMLAKELGITVEELKRKEQVGGIQEAKEQKTNTVTKDIKTEKEELLHELEAPEKSFIKPLFSTINIIKTNTVTQPTKEQTPIPPNHQLQNTHVETPYVEEYTEEHTEIKEEVPQKEVRVPPQKIQQESKPIIKIPTKIVLGMDPYKEPIE